VCVCVCVCMCVCMNTRPRSSMQQEALEKPHEKLSTVYRNGRDCTVSTRARPPLASVCPGPHNYIPHLHGVTIFMFIINIILPSTLRFSKFNVSCRFTDYVTSLSVTSSLSSSSSSLRLQGLMSRDSFRSQYNTPEGPLTAALCFVAACASLTC